MSSAKNASNHLLGSWRHNVYVGFLAYCAKPARLSTEARRPHQHQKLLVVNFEGTVMNYLDFIEAFGNMLETNRCHRTHYFLQVAGLQARANMNRGSAGCAYPDAHLPRLALVPGIVRDRNEGMRNRFGGHRAIQRSRPILCFHCHALAPNNDHSA